MQVNKRANVYIINMHVYKTLQVSFCLIKMLHETRSFIEAKHKGADFNHSVLSNDMVGLSLGWGVISSSRGMSGVL